MPAGGNKGGGANAAPGGSPGKGGYNAIRGGNGADALHGTLGDDWIDGKGGDDTLFGGLGNDLIQGDQGNDIFVGGGGNDYIDGGLDNDTAAYINDAGGTYTTDPADYYSVFDYTIAIDPSGTTITDINLANGDTGVDTLVDVEQAVFSDGDADGDGTAGLVTVYLDGQNNAVLAVADYGSTTEDNSIIFQAADLIANDIEFDGDAKQLTGVGDAVNGSVSLAADGTITFIPDTNFSGEASFSYTVSDGLGGTDTQIVRIHVEAVADAPAISAVDVVGNEDSPIMLNLSVLPADGDGSESITSLVVSGIPVGATLSDGANSFTAVAGTTEVSIAGWDQNSLTITPPADSDADFALTVTAVATEAMNGQTATSIQTINVAVDAVADAPVISVADAAGSEDSPITLSVSAVPADGDGSETITSLVVSGIPVGATLSDGSNSFTAVAGSTEVDIAGWNQATLTITPPADSDADFQLTVTAVATETANGDTAATVGTIAVSVDAVADPPVISVADGGGAEDSPIALSLSVAPADGDGSESITSLVVSGIPAGATLSDGFNSFTAVAGTTEVDIAGWNQAALTITPPADSDADFQLTVTAVATEAMNGDTETAVGTIAVAVNAVADAPALDLDGAAAGDQLAGGAAGVEDTAIALDLAAALTDTDGSETLSVAISGIPAGAELSDGVNSFVGAVGSGDVDITGWNWPALTITPPPNNADPFQLTVTATATESANSSTASTIGTIDVSVSGTVDMPYLDLSSAIAGEQTLGSATGSEDTAIALDLTAVLTDTDGSETLTLEVSGIPVGATLSDGINSFLASAGNTQVDIAGWNQAALTITPPADSDGGFQLTVTATAHEGGDTASVIGHIDVVVDAVADAPSLDLNGALAGAQSVGAATGAQDSAIALDVSGWLNDGDGSETLSSLMVSAIPDGATVSDGVNSFTATAIDGDVDIIGWNWATLTITPPAGSDTDFQLQLMLTSQEISNGDTATAQGSIDVTVLGPAGAQTVDLGNPATYDGFKIAGADIGDESGWTVSSAGDINGDGFDDILIGAINGDGLANATFDGGESYLLFGKAGGFVDIDLGALSPADGFVLGGANPSDKSGGALSSLGDINGDGFDDFIIGAGDAGGGTGESYVILGKAGGFADIDLGTLSASDGFTIFGPTVGDLFGFAVAGAGDINGDGYDDIIVGAYGANSVTGQSYVIFGGAGGFADVDLSAPLAPGSGFIINGGGLSDQAGWSVASAGDVNGDGFDDLIIGANKADGVGDAKSNAGESYVIFGSASGFSDINVGALAPTAGFTIFGADANDGAGYSVAGAGDVNGDGYADIIVSAIGADGAGNLLANSGEAYVVFGKATGIGNIDLAALAPSDGFILRGGDSVDNFGRSVSSAGDINGDGFDDILVGAWNGDGDANAESNAGEAYVIFGKAGGFAPLEVDSLTPTEGFAIFGGAANDRAGGSVSAAGDVNGDGYDDIIVGAPFAAGSEGTGSGAGESYVIFGSNLTGMVTHEGTDASEVLTGTIGADVMVAGLGDDTVIGGGGADVLRGGGGDDLLSIGDTSFARVDGGAGHDTVALEGSGDTLDLTLLGSTEIQGVEAFDLSGTGANQLVLNTQDVLQLSDESNDIQVLGNGDDSVTLVGDFAFASQEVIGSTTFDVYASAGTDARVLAATGDVTVNLVVA